MLHDLSTPTNILLDPLLAFTLAFVSTVEPYVLHTWQFILDIMAKQQLYPISIHDGRVVNLCFQHKSLCIYEQMSLSATDLLATVKAALSSTNTCCFHRLRVNDTSTGLRVTAQSDAQFLTYDLVNALPGAIDPPQAIVMIDSLPRRQVMRKQSPSAAAADDVKGRIEDLAPSVFPRTASFIRSW
jgi:hypothetical protein